jgi:hypothetical protein
MFWMLSVGVTAISEVHSASRGRTAVAIFLMPLELVLVALVLALVVPLVMALAGGVNFAN